MFKSSRIISGHSDAGLGPEVGRSVKRPKRQHMMTYGQLSELFRRLDLSGDGELDLEEFCNIRNKINLDVDEPFLVRFVFSKCSSWLLLTFRSQCF
jgi:hypothetical protein